jgi:hypothetical protein
MHTVGRSGDQGSISPETICFVSETFCTYATSPFAVRRANCSPLLILDSRSGLRRICNIFRLQTINIIRIWVEHNASGRMSQAVPIKGFVCIRLLCFVGWHLQFISRTWHVGFLLANNDPVPDAEGPYGPKHASKLARHWFQFQ